MASVVGVAVCVNNTSTKMMETMCQQIEMRLNDKQKPRFRWPGGVVGLPTYRNCGGGNPLSYLNA